MLDNRIIAEFVDSTYDKPERPTETIHYGELKGGSVQFDGSQIPTPCIVSIDGVSDGDRVIVTIRNNVAYVTGILRRANDGT